MIPYVRQELILKQLAEHELLFIDDLMNALPEASESTVRRDLKKLEAEQKIILLHGGGIKLNETANLDVPLKLKLQTNCSEKERIAMYAAQKVNEGDVIYLDASSTVVPMLRFLKDKSITIITSSTFVSEYLNDTAFFCIIVGGEVKKSTGSLVGPLTENMLQNMHFDLAFLGSNGFSLENGVNAPDFREVQKKKIVHNNSEQTFFLMDSSKYQVNTLCKAFDLSECNIITEQYIPILEEFASYEIAKE